MMVFVFHSAFARREVKRHSAEAGKLRWSFVVSEGVEVETIYNKR